MHQFEQYLALKTIINSNCVLINQAKCFANIALFDPVITLSGPIIPILQVKKKKTEAELGQRTVKRQLLPVASGINPYIHVYLDPEPRI